MSFWASFLGSGIAVAILNWLFSSQAKRTEREASFLEKQLKEVYGPIYLYTSHGKKLYQIAEEIGSLTGTNSDALTQDELDETVDARNDYIKLIWSNGEELKKLLASSYHLIDYDDFDKIQRFLVDYSRLQVEFDENFELKAPSIIYDQMETPLFLDLELVKHIEEKFKEKQKRLNHLASERYISTTGIYELWKGLKNKVLELARKIVRPSH